MMFHEYRSAAAWAKRMNFDVDKFLSGELKTDGNHALEELKRRLEEELLWARERRPYYNIWPGMIDPLFGVDVTKIDPGKVRLPVNSLVIRFPGTFTNIRTILVTCDGEDTWGFRVDDGMSFDLDYPMSSKMTWQFSTDGLIPPRSEVKKRTYLISDMPRTDTVDLIYDAFQITFAIALLRNDPDVIVPKPLAADEHRFQQTGDMSLIEKARRKGCNQFDVGRNIIIQPGVRRPHFAIRHMGKQPDTIPVLRPIKGSIVRRTILTSVPQGYLDDED